MLPTPADLASPRYARGIGRTPRPLFDNKLYNAASF